jgi:hypothetical protein
MMHAAYADPRQALKRAVDEASEPLLRALTDVVVASEEPTGDRMVVIRFHEDGESSSEVFTRTRPPGDSPRPVTLLEAFQAMGEPYREALKRGREVRKELLAAEGGVLSGAEVADLLGLSRQAVDKRRRSGRLIGVSPGSRGIVYPAWQFTEDGVLPGFEEVLSDLPIRDGWSPVLFMLNENAWVDDEIPLHVLRRGEIDRVRRAAQMYLEHGAP